MVDVGLPVPSVDRVRRGEFGNGDAVNPIESPRFATGRVTEEDVFSISYGQTFTLNLRELWCDFEETRGVAPVGEQHPR